MNQDRALHIVRIVLGNCPDTEDDLTVSRHGVEPGKRHFKAVAMPAIGP